MACQPILRSVVGLNKITYLTDQEIINLAVKYRVDTSKLYSINTEKFLSFVNNIDTFSHPNKFIKHDLIQPLQIMYFDSTQKIIFHLINCNVGGFPNLKWNRYGFFNNDPLRMPILYLPDSLLPFDSIYNCILPLYSESKSLNALNTNNQFDDALIIFWNSFMGRQSEKMINTLKLYLDKYPENKTVYFVNTDNLFYYISLQQ